MCIFLRGVTWFSLNSFTQQTKFFRTWSVSGLGFFPAAVLPLALVSYTLLTPGIPRAEGPRLHLQALPGVLQCSLPPVGQADSGTWSAFQLSSTLPLEQDCCCSRTSHVLTAGPGLCSCLSALAHGRCSQGCAKESAVLSSVLCASCSGSRLHPCSHGSSSQSEGSSQLLRVHSS